MFVDINNLPFQITDLEDYISHYVNHLRKLVAISEPTVVTLARLAGNLAHNFTASDKIGQDEYRASDIIMLSGVKKYVAEASDRICVLKDCLSLYPF